MPTREGPDADVTVVLTPPYKMPPTSTTWVIRESLALMVSSPGGGLRLLPSGVGPGFWVAPWLIGRPQVSLVSTTCRSRRRRLPLPSDRWAVTDQTAILLSNG